MAPTPWSGGLLKVGEATAALWRRLDLEQAEHHGTIAKRASEHHTLTRTAYAHAKRQTLSRTPTLSRSRTRTPTLSRSRTRPRARARPRAPRSFHVVGECFTGKLVGRT